AKAVMQPPGTYRNLVCTEVRHSLGNATQRNAVRVRHDLLAATESVATPGRVAATARGAAREAARSQPVGFLTGRCGQLVYSRRGRGKKTGPNPTDRRRPGSKHHVITDAQGIPLNVILTAANDHDVTQ